MNELLRFRGRTPTPIPMYEAFTVLGVLGMTESLDLGITHVGAGGGVSTFEVRDLDTIVGLDDHRQYLTAVEARQTALDSEFAGRAMPAAEDEEFTSLAELRVDLRKRITSLEARQQYIADTFGTEQAEPIGQPIRTVQPAKPGRAPIRAGARTPDDVHNFAEYRRLASDVGDLPVLYRDGAKRAIDAMVFPHNVKEEDGAARLSRFIDSIDTDGKLAQRVLATSHPAYVRGFQQYIRNGAVSEEMRALATYSNSGADGGYAVPVTMDPSLVLTSDGVANPIRSFARTVTITGKEWNGVTSGPVTFSRIGENTAVSGQSPTLTQPRAVPTAAKATIPLSLEVDQDWAQLEAEMLVLLQDARAVEESASFILGTGNGVNGPEGIIGGLGAGSKVNATSTGDFGVEDLFLLRGALPVRFRTNASWMANGSIYDLVRQFNTDSGQGTYWVDLNNDTPPRLLGRPAYEASDMEDTAESDEEILLYGDGRYFLIVDRAGMNVEFVPHMVDGSGVLLGQRALFAWYRNTSLILSDNAFRLLTLAGS